MRDLVSARKTGSNVLEGERKRRTTNKTRKKATKKKRENYEPGMKKYENRERRVKKNCAYTRNVYNPSEKTAAS